MDMFIIGILRFVIGQFKLIQIGLTDLLSNKTKTANHNLYDVYKELIEIIEHHLRMIKLVNFCNFNMQIRQVYFCFRFVEELDKYLNPTTIIHFILCTLMLCTVTLEAVMVINL